jgi:ankyrin repeat protein
MKKQLLLLTLAVYCAVANSGTGTSKQADAKSDAAALQQDSLTLMKASMNGDLAQVKALIAAGAQINKLNGYGNTALRLAAFGGHLEIVQALITAKAELNKQNRFGLTALRSAALCRHLEIVKALVTAGADIDADFINQLPNRVAVWEAIEEGLKDRKWNEF